MNDQLQHDFKDAAEVRAQQIRDERERRENPRKATAENGDAFGEHLEAILTRLREESSIADLLN